MTHLPRVLLAATVLGAASPASARPMQGGVTVDDVARALDQKNFPVEVANEATEQGAARIRSELEGTKFFVRFFGCRSDGRCASIQFVAAYDLPDGTTLDKMNLWNAEYRFGRAYLDAERDPYVAFDADLERGATPEAVSNTVDVWAAVLTQFRSFLAP